MPGRPGITALLDTPFFTGASATSSDNLGRYAVALGGRPYMLDLASKAMKHESIPLVRNQFLTTSKPGEGAISLEDLWRRYAEAWYLGAGQTYFDHSTSSEFRFDASKGVNPWTKWQLTLLNDTQLALSSSNTNLYLSVAGAYLYVTDGNVLKYTQDMTAGPPATWTSVTGNPATPAKSVCSDGNNVYVAYHASGIYSTSRGSASQASYATGNVDVVRYVSGRLMAAYNNSIYNVTTGGGAALPTALFTHANSDFVWVDFAEGPDFIYAAGYSGDKSLIYKTGIKTDGSALDAPAVAGRLPSGEIVRAIFGYGGALIIGSDLGWRKASIAASGALLIGPLISEASPVYGFDGQGEFVYFGWTNYDTTSTGIGRMDLSNEVFPDQPAYASDLMSASGGTVQGTVQSVKTFQAKQLFTVSGVGVYAQATNLVPSGTLDTGLITYGIPDDKTAIKVRAETAPLVGSVGLSLAVENGSFTLLGTESSAGLSHWEFMANETIGRRFEVRYTLTRDAVTTTGPTLYRVTLFADPTAALNQELSIPLMFAPEILDLNDQAQSMDCRFELTYIEGLRESREVITYQEGTATYTVVVKDFTWIPYMQLGDGNFSGTCLVILKTIG